MSWRCGTCQHAGLCAPDCPLGPWNIDLKPAATAFVYLLRQRRWSGWPVDRQDTWFLDREIRHEQERRFFA